MNSLPRWIAFASFAAVLVLATSARAFTDSNAELKEAATDRSARVVIIGKATHAPVQTVWVPQTAKSLDGFKPVFPDERALAQSRTPTLAKADVAAGASKRY